MCFITFHEHFSLKNKTKQNKAKQKYSSGELSIREKSKIIFKFFYGWENGAGPGGCCSVTGVMLEFGFLGGYLVILELSPSACSFPQASQSTLFCTLCFSLSFSSLCLCLTWPRDQDLSFSLENKTFPIPAHGTGILVDGQWITGVGSKATAYIFQPLLGRLMLLLHLNEHRLQKGTS